jgi:hypothetical protein
LTTLKGSVSVMNLLASADTAMASLMPSRILICVCVGGGGKGRAGKASGCDGGKHEPLGLLVKLHKTAMASLMPSRILTCVLWCVCRGGGGEGGAYHVGKQGKGEWQD